MFGTVIDFSSILTFAGKGGAYPGGAPLLNFTLKFSSAIDKRSSLVQHGIKSFSCAFPWVVISKNILKILSNIIFKMATYPKMDRDILSEQFVLKVPLSSCKKFCE